MLESLPGVGKVKARRVMSEIAEIIMSREPALTFLVESARSSRITETSRVP